MQNKTLGEILGDQREVCVAVITELGWTHRIYIVRTIPKYDWVMPRVSIRKDSEFEGSTFQRILWDERASNTYENLQRWIDSAFKKTGEVIYC